MPAGYSKPSLIEKLGIKPNSRLAILNAPPGYRILLGRLPPAGRVFTAARGTASCDFIQCFTRTQRDLDRRFARCLRARTKLESMRPIWSVRCNRGSFRCGLT